MPLVVSIMVVRTDDTGVETTGESTDESSLHFGRIEQWVWNQWGERRRREEEKRLSHGEKLWRKWQKVRDRSGGRWAVLQADVGDKIVSYI